MFKFLVYEAWEGLYEKEMGEPLPDTIEFDSLDQLMDWIRRSGHDVVVDAKPEPSITVYNGFLE